ncbi:MAG: alpha/beta hydrolase [Acidimicrobiales bacterium]
MTLGPELDRELDPELAAALAVLPDRGRGVRLDDLTLIRSLRDSKALGTVLPTDPRVNTEDLTVPGVGGRTLTVRVYTPEERQGGITLFFHGGAYLLGDIYMEERRCLTMAAEGRCIVASASYALAPEDPYPAALDDAMAALDWVAANAAGLGGDASRLAVSGASAGGGLAAAVALAARDRGGPRIAFQMLVYPMLDDRQDTPSQRHSADMALINAAALADGWRQYLGGPGGPGGPAGPGGPGSRAADCYAAPARAESLAGLPAAYVMVCEQDPLRDEGIEYARRLTQVGVNCELHQFAGAYHGFDLMAPGSALGIRALSEQAAVLRRALAS